MRYFLYETNTGGDDKLMEVTVTNGQITQAGEALNIPNSDDVKVSQDISVLREALSNLIAWRDQQVSTNDNGQIDTMKEAIDAMNDMEHKDISKDTVDSWFEEPNNE